MRGNLFNNFKELHSPTSASNKPIFAILKPPRAFWKPVGSMNLHGQTIVTAPPFQWGVGATFTFASSQSRSFQHHKMYLCQLMGGGVQWRTGKGERQQESSPSLECNTLKVLKEQQIVPVLACRSKVGGAAPLSANLPRSLRLSIPLPLAYPTGGTGPTASPSHKPVPLGVQPHPEETPCHLMLGGM